MDIQCWLSDNKENIIKIIELEDVLSKSDPCENPYKSQYAARDILQSCLTDLESWMKEDTSRLTHVSYFVFFNLSYRLANNFISTEERYSGEEIIFSLCKKIEQISQLELFLKQISKVTPNGDIDDLKDNISVLNVLESGESETGDSQLWIRWLAGILIRIYNASGLLWSGRIMNIGPSDSSILNDTGYRNSIQFLNQAKRIYKIYKKRNKLQNEEPLKSHTEITFDYLAPECFDSLLLSLWQYETPYLQNECYLMEGAKKNDGLRFDLFESDYTTTLFLLAQTYGKLTGQVNMKHKSAKYCYCTLYRQLNALKYDPVEWSLNAATLSQYYVVEGAFRRARHCIAAAQNILKEAICRPTPGPKPEPRKAGNVANEKSETCDNSKSMESKLDCNQTIESILEESVDKIVDQMDQNSESNMSSNVGTKKSTSKQRKLLPDPMSESRLWDDDVYEEKRVQGEADVDRCWVSYGLNLLELSFERNMPDYTGPTETDKFLIESKLPDFNLELAAIEREVTHEWVYSYDEARKLFLFVQRKINSARQYYRIDFRCSDAIELVCDHSKAFKAISNFEMSTERKCIMHKKRIDMLTELLGTLNQKYYLIPCRKMMLEIGEVYSTMMNLKLSLLETTEDSNELIKLPPNAKGIVQKLRLLGKKGLTVYENFLDSYRNQDGIMPEIYSEDDVRPVMIAHFYMARMYSKILEPDSKARLNNLVISLKHYQYIVNYCNKHDIAAKLMSAELDSCKDMTILLPKKIDKLRSEC